MRITPEAREGRSPADELFDELLDLSARRRREALKQERFQDSFLAELLIAECEAAQPEDPRWAVELSGLALALDAGLEASGKEGAGSYLMSRCRCLRGNARRLAGQPRIEPLPFV